MKIAKDFLKHVPIEKLEIVKDKLQQFSQIRLETRTFQDIPKGFWIRKVAVTNIYKFRVNSGDRILFTFDNEGDLQSIFFLSYQNHDSQIRVAKNILNMIAYDRFDINLEEYQNEEIDERLDVYIQQELYDKLQEVKEHYVYDDEYVSLVIEDDFPNTINILTNE